MKNVSRLRGLTNEQLAYFEMLFDSCQKCIYLDEMGEKPAMWDNCDEGSRPEEETCLTGHRAWLERESTKEDDRMFQLCVHNDVVDRYNNLPDYVRHGIRLVYKDGLAVGLEQIENAFDDGWKAPMPF